MVKINLFIFFLIIFTSVVCSQVAPEKYRLYLTDKNNNQYNINNPEQFLSSEAIARRTKFNIAITNNDLPVTKMYIDSLRSLGLQILNTSKWFNTVTVKTTDLALLDTITNLSFIQNKYKIEEISNFKNNEKFGNIINEKPQNKAYTLIDYGSSANQIQMLNGHVLHNLGYKGENINIAVIDAGFYKVNVIPAFDSLKINNRIIGTRDFVDGDTSIYEHHDHGTYVLSIIGANLPGSYVGTAPNANFWLLRSEDTNSEYIIEEDNWASAAEFADSVGIDIINVSLGYNLFNNPNHNHSYFDLDGNTTIITKAVDIASSKGILVVVSAGNEGSSNWKYITAPADADSALTVGAVDGNGFYASLSSVGPTVDGRIKPTIVAQGNGTAVISTSGTITNGNGTSFSAPIITGLAACLWQANPNYNNMQIIEAIVKSASKYTSPDSLYGYGIPDFGKANLLLNNINHSNFDYDKLANIYPNPFNNELNIDFYSADSQKVKIEITSMIGQVVFEKDYKLNLTTYNKILIQELSYLRNGIYTISVSTDKNKYQAKIFKF